MPYSFDETKAQFEAVYGAPLEFSPHAFNAFAPPRRPSLLERAFTTDVKRTALIASAVSYAVLAGRINMH